MVGAARMNITVRYRRDPGHPPYSQGGEEWSVEVAGIEGYDGDRAVQAILDAAALLKVGAYGNAQLIVEGLAALKNPVPDTGPDP